MHRLLIVLVIALSLSRPAWAGPALLFDVNNGMVLYTNEADQPWYPASLTKLMTAYVVFEALRDGGLDLSHRAGWEKSSFPRTRRRTARVRHGDVRPGP